AGAGAHDFQFTFDARRKLERANLIIANGLGLDSWVDRALRDSVRAPVIRCAEGFSDELIPPDSSTPNPHVWLDPVLACRMVSNILAGLQRADPGHAALYSSNATAFVARLDALERDFQAGLSSITNRALVTSHDAFPYLA